MKHAVLILTVLLTSCGGGDEVQYRELGVLERCDVISTDGRCPVDMITQVPFPHAEL